MFVRWLLIDVEHWLLSLPAVRLGKYRLTLAVGSGNDELRAVGRLDTLLGPEETGTFLRTAGPVPVTPQGCGLVDPVVF
ncbi:hypothetical protein DMH08_40000 [Actinomadura sp. WAC 06369]|nr:hypothetical protein DMH08_40000 [Actinomadura sp. WAC 06369]